MKKKKRAIPFFTLAQAYLRRCWPMSAEYKEFTVSKKSGTKYRCDNCGKLESLANMYVEHIKAIKLIGFSTIDQFYGLLTDLTNCELWYKTHKKDKDTADRKLIRERKKNAGKK